MAVSQQAAEPVVLCPPRPRFSPVVTFLGAVCALFLILFLKRPDSLLAPQFFAEDGRIFFHDQILFGGWEAFFTPYAGYLLFIPRLVALLAFLFPIEFAPAVYNTCALLIAACCCALFTLPAFRWILASDALRFAVCCLIAAALDSGELSGTITQIQWYLQLAGILIVLYSGRKDFPHKTWVDILLAVFLFIICLSVPLMILVAPVALWVFLRARGSARIPSLALFAGVAVQLYVYANAGMGRGQSALFNPHELPSSTGVYLAFRAVLASLMGRIPAAELCARAMVRPSILVGIAVLIWLAWLWIKSPRPVRWNILGCLYFAVASAALAVGARNLPRVSQTITFGGERYFYLASCCLVLLVAITIERFAWKLPVKIAALTAVFAAGLWGNFKVPAYADMHWDLYCEHIADWEDEAQSAKTVHPISVPLNPVGWTLILEGNELGNPGFEEVYPAPWVGMGNIGMAITRDFHSHGNGSLVVSGTEGDVHQMVWGLKAGDPMRAQASVLMPCKPDLVASLVVEDDKGHQVGGTTSNTSFDCGSWRPLVVHFEAPDSERVLIKLQYRGNGQSILWDDVELRPDH